MRASENPFRSECIEALHFRCTRQQRDGFREKLNSSGRRGAIVGPHGSGKTTFLLELKREVTQRGCLVQWIKLTHDQPRPRLHHQVDDSTVVLLDSAEWMPARLWRGFVDSTSAAHAVVITQHAETRWPTLLQTAVSPTLLADLVDELLIEPRVSDAIRNNLPDLNALFTRHRGNIRLCLRELYDICADLDSTPASRSWQHVPGRLH